MNRKKEFLARIALLVILFVCLFAESWIEGYGEIHGKATEAHETHGVVQEYHPGVQSQEKATEEATEDIPEFVNNTPLSDEEYRTLLEVCEENRIDPSLALGLIEVESNFRADAVSKAGCYGYCQINPSWHPADLSPEENIRYGVGFLASQFERYGNLESGLTAYNAGHDTGDTSYARKVMRAAEEWRDKI